MAEFLFPAVAIAVVAALMGQMLSGHHAASSLSYVGLLGAILVALALIGAAKAAVVLVRDGRSSASGEEGGNERPNYRAVVLLCALTAATIFALEPLGYLPVMFAYLVTVGRMLYRGPWRVTLGTSLAMVLLVHVMFVGQLDLDLPAGSLWLDLRSSWLD